MRSLPERFLKLGLLELVLQHGSPQLGMLMGERWEAGNHYERREGCLDDREGSPQHRKGGVSDGRLGESHRAEEEEADQEGTNTLNRQASEL